MQLRIYDPSPETEQVIRLMLQPSNVEEGIEIIVVDASGERLPKGSLCIINASGIRRFTRVSKVLGFPLHGDGRLHDLGM